MLPQEAKTDEPKRIRSKRQLLALCLTHSLTHSLTLSLSHSLTHSLSHSLTHSLSLSLAFFLYVCLPVCLSVFSVFPIRFFFLFLCLGYSFFGVPTHLPHIFSELRPSQLGPSRRRSWVWETAPARSITARSVNHETTGGTNARIDVGRMRGVVG